MQPILLFPILILTTLIFYIYNKRRFDIYVLLLLNWVVTAVFSVYLYYSMNVVTSLNFNQLTYLPSIYLFVTLMISFMPIKKMAALKIRHIEVNKNVLLLVSMFIIAVSIIPFIENLIHVIKTLSSSNAELLIAQQYVNNIDIGSESLDWFSRVGRICNTISQIFAFNIPIILLYWLGQNNRNPYVIGGMLMALFNTCLFSTAIASRASILQIIAYYVFLYMFLRFTLSDRVRKKIAKSGIILLGFVVSILLIISLSRFNQQSTRANTIFDWVAIYAGESTVRFNLDMWNIRTTMDGDNCFPFFKRLVGADTFIEIADRRSYWEPRTGVTGNVFYTFVGDFYGDMGPIGTLIFIIAIVMIINRFVKRRDTIQFHHLLIIAIWCQVCLLGFTYFPFKTHFGNVLVFMNIVLSIIFYLTSHRKNIYH